VQTATSDVVDTVGINIPKGEHGAKVSDAAHDKTVEGKNHGQDVSTVARDNHGHATTTTVVGDEDNSGPGNNGKGQANGHTKQDSTDDDGGDDGTTTSTTVKDHSNKGKSGDHTDAPSEHSGSDD
jgi:hypothetical protein